MSHPQNSELYKKQALSLHRAYILVGVVGVIMLVFIVNNYIDTRRLNELTSPLWSAVKEVKLEATAVQHEAKDLLRGEIDPDADMMWFYLDQSIWHLANLLNSHQQSSRSWWFTEKLDVGGRVEAISGSLVQMKALLNAPEGELKLQDARAEKIARLDNHIDGFQFQLDELEADISRLMLKEQLQQRVSSAVLVVFCVAMIGLVTYQIRRYERYRKASFETVNRANVQLARQFEERQRAENDLRVSYAFMKIANDNREIDQMLSQFTASIQLNTGCSQCSIRLLSDTGALEDDRSPASDPDGTGCDLDTNALKASRSMCARVLNNDVDPSLAWFTPFGSYFFDRSKQDDGLADPEPESCERHQCARMGYRSLALVPIKGGEQVLGLILIADAAKGKLNQAIVERMETAAMHVGAAIRRLRAEAELDRAKQELEVRVSERTQALSDMNRELQTEIEERRRIEDRLRENRNTLQTVIDGLNDSLVLVDKDMKIRMLNRVAAQTYRILSLDSAIGKLCHRVISRVGSCENCEIPRAVQRRESITFERQGVVDAEKLERVTIYPVTEADDASGGAIIRICDITEEKRFEQQLIQSEKMASLGILVSSIGHEINNPNNFITFNIPILREYLEALTRISDQHADAHPDFELFHMRYDEFRDDVFKLVDNIEHGASRISSFVSNLREFSQSNGNREKVWLELPAVIDKVISICRSQIKKRVRNFKIDIPADLPPIYADEYSIEQVLLNLIVNAVQAADKVDAMVRLSASTGDTWRDTTIIAVSDNGVGIDENMLGKIFNPFYTTKSASEGTGLGLYVCHNLVQRLGGRIKAESKKGQGSTFTIFLPDKERRENARDRI
jgi:signal transduction histidine kinase/GAF domain-containing protein